MAMANRLITPIVFSRSSKSRSLPEVTTQSDRDYSWWRRKNTYVEHALFGGSQLDKLKRTVWPDPTLECLGPMDQRLTFPGNVGLDEALSADKPTLERLQQDKEFLEKDVEFWKSLLKSPTNHERQGEVLQSTADVEQYEAEMLETLENSLLGKDIRIECTALPCPDLLRKELASIFSSVNLAEGALTVITLSLKSKYDMTSWSPEVEEERVVIIEKFIQTAKDVCRKLREKGQWADFIEPTSGRPFYGVYTNQTSFETDERYRYLAFQILDFGCCTVISHIKWETHVSIGSMFTNAPTDCAQLQEILVKYSQ